MADLPQRAAGETGHILDHNAIATWLNAQGYNEGQDVLNHTGFPGGTANFLRADGSWASPGGAAGSPGFNTAMGWQFVRASGGSDANDGASPSTAKATIAAAHSALPTTGGTIFLSEGTHIITTQTNISKRAVALIGAGRTATRLKCGTAGIHMIYWTGADGHCAHFTVTDGTGGDMATPVLGRGLSGIWLDNAQEMVMLNVRFDGFGIGAPTGATWDAGPAGLRIYTATGFGDWMQFYSCVFRRCYRGTAISSGNNGSFYGCAWYSQGEERIFAEKRSSPAGDSMAFHFFGCHFAGAGTADRFSVRIDHGVGATSPYRMGWTFNGCAIELSAATTGLGGVYVNGTEVGFDQTIITTQAKPSVRTGPDGNVRFGRFIGPSPLLQSPVGNNNLRTWISTDDSGTVASGAVQTY